MLYFFFLHKQFSLDHYFVGLGTEVEGIIQVKLEECRTIITNTDMQKVKSLVWPPFKRKHLHFLCWFHMKSFQLSCFTDRIFETVERKTQFQCCLIVLKTYWLYQPKEPERRTPRWWCTSPGQWVMKETRMQSLTPDGSADALFPDFNLLQSLFLPVWTYYLAYL